MEGSEINKKILCLEKEFVKMLNPDALNIYLEIDFLREQLFELNNTDKKLIN